MTRRAWEFWRRDEPTAAQEFDEALDEVLDGLQAQILENFARRRELQEETNRARR